MKKIRHNNLIFIFFLSLIAGILISTFFSVKKAQIANQYTLHNINKVFSETVKICQDKESCYPDQFRKITLKHDSKVAFAVLNKLVQEKPKFSFCHFMAHSIGQGIFEKDPINWKSKLGKLSEECSYGASHGLLEQYSASLRQKNESILSKNYMQTICKDQIPSCGHILGHIVLIETEANVPKALSACKALTGAYYTWCINGIFMEYTYPKTLVEHQLVDRSKLITRGRRDELSTYCTSFEDPTVSSICWGEISRSAMSDFGNDWKSIFSFCDTAPFTDAIKKCKDRTIEMLAVSSRYDIMRLKPMCRYSPDQDLEKSCYNRLIGGKTTNQLNIETDDLAKFCNSLKQQFKESCFQQIGNALLRRDIKTASVNTICKEAPDEFKDKCLGMKKVKAKDPSFRE